MEAKGKENLGKSSLEISRRMRTEKWPSDLTVGNSNSSQHESGWGWWQGRKE